MVFSQNDLFVPVKYIHEFMFTVWNTEFHDFVQKIHQKMGEIVVKCHNRLFKIFTSC